MKFFSLCDSSGYLYNTTIYVGSDASKEYEDNSGNKSKTAKVVMEAIEPILNNG